MTIEFQQSQLDIDKEIASAIIECTPEEYYDFELTLTYRKNYSGSIGTIEHILCSLDGKDNTLTPSIDVYSATQKLNRLFFEHKIEWEQVIYHVHCDESDKWHYQVDFKYPKQEARN